MILQGNVNVVIACIFDQIFLEILSKSGPIALILTNSLKRFKIAIAIKSNELIQTVSLYRKNKFPLIKIRQLNRTISP